MPPTAKRPRPAFSPPRPHKSTTKPTKSTNGITKASTSRASVASRSTSNINKRRRQTFVDDEAEADDDSDDDDEQEEDQSRASNDDESDNDEPSALRLVDMSASASEASLASDPPDQHEDTDANMMLVEVTHETVRPIPATLVHTILHHHFARPEKTTITKDARDLVGKYIEVFVREAVARSVFEHEERNKGGSEGGGGGGVYLEVDDLEGVAAQLVTDF